MIRPSRQYRRNDLIQVSHIRAEQQDATSAHFNFQPSLGLAGYGDDLKALRLEMLALGKGDRIATERENGVFALRHQFEVDMDADIITYHAYLVVRKSIERKKRRAPQSSPKLECSR